MNRIIARKARWREASTACVLALALINGCAHVRPTESGYLTDYSKMVPERVRFHSMGGLQRLVSRPPTPEGLDGIESFYVEPVAWLVDPKTSAAADEDLRRRVTSAFEIDLKKQLGAIRPVVDAPGANTATVRAAITEVVRARPVTNVILTAVAVPLANGGGTFEVEVVGPDHRQIAAVCSSSSGGALELLGYFSRSKQAADAARRAAAELKNALGAPTR
jgi:hypothetical protein